MQVLWHHQWSFWAQVIECCCNSNCPPCKAGELLVSAYLLLRHALIAPLLQAASACLAAAFACSWLFDTDHESILHFDGLAVQLQSRLRCGAVSYDCLLVEQLQDIVICEVLSGLHTHVSHLECGHKSNILLCMCST